MICLRSRSLVPGDKRLIAFIDGNKRTGAHAMLVTLKLNNIKLFYTQDELSSVFWQLAADKIGYDELREWVLKHMKNEGI